MNVKPGDRVKFLNDVGGGIVKKVNGNIAEVESEEGFVIPVLLSELVVDENLSFDIKVQPKESLPELNASDDNIYSEIEDVFDVHKFRRNYNQNKAQQEAEPQKEKHTNVSAEDVLKTFLGIVQVRNKKNIVEHIDIYLINDCNFKLLYNFVSEKHNTVQHVDAGIMHEDSKLKVGSYLITEISGLTRFELQFIPFKTTNYVKQEPQTYKLEVNAKKWLQDKSFVETDFFDFPAIIEEVRQLSFEEKVEKIQEKELKKVIKEKGKVDQSVIQKKKIELEDTLVEVDLHIEELIDDHRNLSNAEILEIQLSRFEIALETAIKGHTKRIVFIHGVGNGKLKFELRKLLDGKYKKYRYQDASFKEYGFGATMVMV